MAAGLSDPYVATALIAVHSDLAARWTLLSLAEVAGLSRSAFAARFADAMHQSPMQYVTQCRMRRAMTLLRSEQLPIAAVATRVGYSSEAALSAAFVRHVGFHLGTIGGPANSMTKSTNRSHRPMSSR